jgi:hypothetical protein
MLEPQVLDHRKVGFDEVEEPDQLKSMHFVAITAPEQKDLLGNV